MSFINQLQDPEIGKEHCCDLLKEMELADDDNSTSNTEEGEPSQDHDIIYGPLEAAASDDIQQNQVVPSSPPPPAALPHRREGIGAFRL